MLLFDLLFLLKYYGQVSVKFAILIAFILFQIQFSCDRYLSFFSKKKEKKKKKNISFGSSKQMNK